ncbi:hypothetical protein ACIBI9_31210 [Nonomuraea sp. NPDC050451]|uniref:hypothetical protein n=1 Tax=Nonomuraea sp. NPDC050451 TaxID=3364364 RepID=UPI0037979058
MKTVVWMSSTYHFPTDANDRGFFPEKDEKGRPTGRLLDSGNWNRRRNKRYQAIRNGFITPED